MNSFQNFKNIENNHDQNGSCSIENGGDEAEVTKKRKLSMGKTLLSGIQLEVLQYENEKLKQLIEELGNEKLQQINIDQQGQKIIRLEDTVTKLQSKIIDLQEKNEMLKNESKINSDLQKSIIENDAEKIKILENEKKEFEGKIKELSEENLLVKTIKTEIKDSVEEEHKTVQATLKKLNTEILELKNKNNNLELNNKNVLENFEKEMEDQRKSSQITVNKLNVRINNLTKQNIDLTNEKNLLQSSFDDLQKIIHENETKASEEQIISLNEAFKDSKPNLSLLSCKCNVDFHLSCCFKVLKITKIENGYGIWSLYSNDSEKLYILNNSDLIKTCFKININGEFVLSGFSHEFNSIFERINTCQLTKLRINSGIINFADYLKLVSSKTIQTCILERMIINGHHGTQCRIDELLKELPNVKEFKYHFHDFENQSEAASNLSKLPSFINLQKFELLSLSKSFKLQDFDGFIKENNKNIRYFLTFDNETLKSMKKDIRKAEKLLLKSLPFPCFLSVEFEQD